MSIKKCSSNHRSFFFYLNSSSGEVLIMAVLSFIPLESLSFFLGGGGHMHPFLVCAQYRMWKINFWLCRERFWKNPVLIRDCTEVQRNTGNRGDQPAWLVFQLSRAQCPPSRAWLTMPALRVQYVGGGGSSRLMSRDGKQNLEAERRAKIMILWTNVQ